MVKIGVFDSGIGGQAVAEALQRLIPEALLTVVNDREHVPYGSKKPAEVLQLTATAIQPLITEPHDVIVIACNTATTVALPTLRKQYAHQLFIGLEPMVKPAAENTKTGTICVCATPATLASKRYKELKTAYAHNVTVLEPDCSTWAAMIEANNVNQAEIRRTIEEALARRADCIVLGCTHYHWIKSRIETIVANRALVLEPSDAITRQVRRLLAL